MSNPRRLVLGAWSVEVCCVLAFFSFALFATSCGAAATSAGELFAHGSEAYADGKYDHAAESFLASATLNPASGAWHNLGNSEWQLGQAGPAILAWERALWLNPFNTNAHSNLRFARKARLLDAPELTWYEICSTWLPANAWPWLASVSFWIAVAMVVLPGVFRWRRAGWHQALAAAGFAIFLLTLPALVGIQSRAKICVVLPLNANLRLTPTTDAQTIARLAAGETVRFERQRGNYLFVRTSGAAGWVEHAQLGFIAD